MVDFAALAVTVPLLALALAAATRGHRTPAAAGVSVLGAALAVLVGAIGGGPAADQIYDVGSVLILLSTLTILAHLADVEGVFAWAARLLQTGRDPSSVAMFRRLILVTAVTTAVLTVDSTVLLLTPVVLVTVSRMRLPTRAPSYACGPLANSTSLLLPVSNLTNLLAFSATGLSLLSFTAFMALPWLVALLIEYALLRRLYAPDLDTQPAQQASPASEQPPAPRLAIAVLALTVLGFVVASALGMALVWPVAAGAGVLAVRQLIGRRNTVGDIMEAANLSFALFVGGLAVIVRGIQENGVGDLLAAALPDGVSLAALLAVAGFSAVLTNLVGNIAATLFLAPAAALVGTPSILAVLIGVNIGANLSYLGSHSLLVWRRIARPYAAAPRPSDFIKTGVLTAPPTLIAATAALWISVRLFG
ncbi:MAG: arsenic transporter [Geodermatophilaceae bacterium]|nr:arsenic transporter [Geodermatophilaceae bacterium]